MVIAGSLMGLNESHNIDMTAGIKPTDYSMCGSVMEACYQMMSEVAINENNFIKAIALKEMSYFQENGVEIVYEEGGLKALLGRAVEMVKKWFSKVLGVLQRVMTQISVQLANITKSFGPQVKNLKEGEMIFPADKAFKDYNYYAAFKSINGVAFLFEKTEADPFAMIAKQDMNKKDSYYMATAIEHEAHDFVEGEKEINVSNIKAKHLGKSDVDINGSIYSIAICKEAVIGFKDGIKSINDRRNSAKSITNKMIKSLKDAEKEINGGLKGKDTKGERKDNSKMISECITTTNRINAANSALLTATISILLGYLNQAKRCTGIYLTSIKKGKKAASSSTEKTPVPESAMDFDFELV